MKRSTALAECPFATHPDFLAFCLAWERDGEIPVPLADWLRDREWEAFADAAQWVGDNRLSPFAIRSEDDRVFLLSDGTDHFHWDKTTVLWGLRVPANLREHLPLSTTPVIGPRGLGRQPAFTSLPEAAANLLRAVACAHGSTISYTASST